MCPFDWEYLEVEFACYKFISDHLNWKDATERCKADGGLIGHLATITTPEKNEFIAGPITGGVKTWIGGTRDQFNGELSCHGLYIHTLYDRGGLGLKTGSGIFHLDRAIIY